MTALLSEALTLAHGDLVAVDDVSVSFAPGRLTCVIGPNGCGKSTLLAGLSRQHRAASGSVLLDGRQLATLRPRDVALRLGLLPQRAEAPDGLTVHDLVRFGRHPHQGLLRQWSRADDEAVSAALAAAGVTALARRPLETLSGGQRQRAWIAMAVAQGTPVLLLDEPTAALDMGHQLEVFQLLRALAAQGRTVVAVVHDLTAACRWSDELVAMNEGSVVAQGPPASVVTPELVRRLYGVVADVMHDPATGCPVVIPRRVAT